MFLQSHLQGQNYYQINLLLIIQQLLNQEKKTNRNSAYVFINAEKN